jgi:hypothetical protein
MTYEMCALHQILFELSTQGACDRLGTWHLWERLQIRKTYLFTFLKGHDHLQYLGVYMMEILKMILKKHIVSQDRG